MFKIAYYKPVDTEMQIFIRERIKALLKQTGVSALDLSYGIDHGHSYISNVVRGKSSISLKGLAAVLEYFGITHFEFFDQSIDMPVQARELLDSAQSLSEQDFQVLVRIAKSMSAREGK